MSRLIPSESVKMIKTLNTEKAHGWGNILITDADLWWSYCLAYYVSIWNGIEREKISKHMEKSKCGSCP